MAEENWDIIWEIEQERKFNEPNIERCSSFKRIEKIVIKSDPKEMIEIGCGTGLTTLLLAQKLGLKVHLFDNSRLALNLARRNAKYLGVEACVTQGSILSMPFADNTFEFVLSLGVNEHFKGKERQIVFNEMARITKPKGVCVVTVPNIYYLPVNFSRYVLIKRGIWPFGYEKPFSKKELKMRMENAGIADIKIWNSDFFIGFHFVFTCLPFLRKKCNLNNHFYKKVWNYLQQLDNLITVIPGMLYIAYGVKVDTSTRI